MINKWEKIEEDDKEEVEEDDKEEVEEDDKEEVHKAFVGKFCECLKISEDEAEKMWGDTIFDVYAKTALKNLKQGESLDGTGIIEFQKDLIIF